jgi:hypothetical protein
MEKRRVLTGKESVRVEGYTKVTKRKGPFNKPSI